MLNIRNNILSSEKEMKNEIEKKMVEIEVSREEREFDLYLEEFFEKKMAEIEVLRKRNALSKHCLGHGA
jgi:hypothetical protein